MISVMTTEVMAEMDTKTPLGEVKEPGGPSDGEIIHVDGEVT